MEDEGCPMTTDECFRNPSWSTERTVWDWCGFDLVVKSQLTILEIDGTIIFPWENVV
jgi:hypothetical protein